MLLLLVLASLSMFLVSSSGLLVNIYLFLKFFKKPHDNDFSKICHAKTIPNILVCAAYLFWAVPLSSFNVSLDQIPILLNSLIEQIGITGPYIGRPILQCLMSVNIWFGVYFPLRKLQSSRCTDVALIVQLILITGYLIRNIITSCGAYYSPQLFTWTADSECSLALYNTTVIIVLSFSIISNVFTILTFFKLCVERVSGLSSDTMTMRRKRRLRFFVQSLCQDCLHIIDVINWQYITNLSDKIWFQFLFSSLSLLLIHALDGFVMLFFFRDKKKKSNRIFNTTSHT